MATCGRGQKRLRAGVAAAVAVAAVVSFHLILGSALFTGFLSYGGVTGRTGSGWVVTYALLSYAALPSIAIMMMFAALTSDKTRHQRKVEHRTGQPWSVPPQ